MTGQQHDEKLSFALSDRYRAEVCRLVETGEASQAFLEFVESSKDAQAAISVMYAEKRAAADRLGALLKSSSRPVRTSSLRALSNARTVRLADDGKKLSVTGVHEIGIIESAGEHKGEIYGGILPDDNKPIWFLRAPKAMDHYNAAAWAESQGGSLPTRKQGDYLTTLKGKGGAFTELFNRGGSFPAGYVWLAEPGTYSRYDAWCQRLSDGYQGYDNRSGELPALCVRR